MLCTELNKFNVHSSDEATAFTPVLQVELLDAVHRVESSTSILRREQQLSFLSSRWSFLMLCIELNKFNVHSSDGATALVPVLQVELLGAVHRVEQGQRPFFGWSNSSRSCSPGEAS